MSGEQDDLWAAKAKEQAYLEAVADAREETEHLHRQDTPPDPPSGRLRMPFLGEYSTRLDDRTIELGHRRVAELRAQIARNRAQRDERGVAS